MGERTTSESRDGPEATLGRLIRAAGRRPAPPDQHYERTLEAALGSWQGAVRRRRVRQRVVGAAAGIAVLAAAAYLLLPQFAAPAGIAGVERVAGVVRARATEALPWSPLAVGTARIARGTEVQTLAGAGAALRLAAGASLRLAGSTRLVLSSATEVQLLAGRVYVDSGGVDAAAQVTVHSAGGSARDVGTQFELGYDPAVFEARLRVREGQVWLRRGAVERLVSSGEQLQAGPGGISGSTQIPRDDASWDWVQQLAVPPRVDGQPVAVLLHWAARETGRQLRYDSATAERHAATTRLRGDIGELAPLQVLDVMLATTDLAYTLAAGSIVIRVKNAPPESRPG
ncbi:MAG: FecR domain-containing protein [Gammaproteobacteria bacterium]|nr:FecR domain-containing protein [Gammaproteobacteria bacterium]